MWTQTVALAAMLTACASHPHGMMPRELRGESQRVHAAVRALLGGDDAVGGDCSSCYSQGTMTGQNGWVADHNYYRRGHSRRHVTLR